MDMFTLNPSGLLNKITDPLIDFDNYSNYDPTFISRYIVQASLIKAYMDYLKLDNLKVLDVGGSGSIIKDFVDIDLHILDVKPNKDNENNYTEGDALNMPFEDNEFDLIISCDVLEHIKNEDRKQFIKECTRVTKDVLVIAAPFNLTGVRLAEISANRFYKNMTGQDHIWLQEHLADELPEIEQTKKTLTEAGFRNDHFSHTSLGYWQLLTRINFIMGEAGHKQKSLIDDIKAINDFYLTNIMINDFSRTGYRSFIVSSKKDQVNVIKIQDKFDPYLENIFSLLTEAIQGLV